MPSPVASPLCSEDPVSRLRASYFACREITRAAKSSFPLAFLLLPRAKRHAMDALYAYMRITDDLSDEDGPVERKREQLRDWRQALESACETERFPATLPPRVTLILPAVVDTVRRFDIPLEHLTAVIDGVEMDLEPVRFETFEELAPYLFRVASAVGLACLPVWGFRSGVTAADARIPAEAAGIAFQLTNILRDVGEDLARGRVYLPTADLARFHCPPERWHDPASRKDFLALMDFQIDRARDYYRQSEPLLTLLSRDGRGIFHAMSRTYRELLEAVAQRRDDVLTQRVRLPKWRKCLALLSAWPARWGWR